jgi:hypothetical protein
MPWRFFKRDVLDPALDDINGCLANGERTTELSTSCAPERQGRTDRRRGKVDAVVFQVTERKTLTETKSKLRLLGKATARVAS